MPTKRWTPPKDKKTPSSTELRQAKAARMDKVAKMYMDGVHPEDIAEEFNVSVSAIRNDIKGIRKAWVEDVVVDFNERQAIELQELDWQIQEAKQAWTRSKVEAREQLERDEASDLGVKKVTELRRRSTSGDPRFLKIIQQAQELRLRMFNMIGPENVFNFNMNDSSQDVHPLERLAKSSRIPEEQIVIQPIEVKPIERKEDG